MKIGMTRDLEAATSALASEVVRKFGPNCPCCGHPMRVPRGRKALANYVGRDRRTIAHDFPTGLGGSFKIWVYACKGCNTDQGEMTFWLWAKRLARQGDPRARLVYRLADFIYQYRKDYREKRLARAQEAYENERPD